MPNVIKFRPRKPVAPVVSTAVLEGPALRAEIEEAAQAALDQADRLIALLDRMDGGPDDEDSGDNEPSLAASEWHDSQVIWLRGSDSDLET